MATIDLGKIKFVNKGAYNNSTAYTPDDVVTSGGSSYICKLASQGNAVTNGTYWDVLAQKGTDGTDVGTTLTTKGDILYRDGSGLQRLAAGTNGQLLKTGGSGANPSWTNAPAGITQADQYRPTGSTSGTHQTITSWERPDTGNFGYIGSGMTQSSGVFTFPETGKYWIQFRAQMYNPSGGSKYQGFDIDTTTDNGSNWVMSAIGYTLSYTDQSYSTGSVSFIFNCSNTGTHKVRFGSNSTHSATLTIVGGSGTNESEVTFIRLGD